MKDSVLKNLLLPAEDIARGAGRLVLKFYHDGAKACVKSDGSLVTEADHAAEAFILSRLEKLTPHIPVVSEEAAEKGIRPDISKRSFWVADPLDGTEGFVNKTGKFVVAMALIADGRAVLGVIYDPLTDTMYSSAGPGTATKTDSAGIRTSLAVKEMAREACVLVNDASVDVPAVENYLQQQFNRASVKSDKRGTNLRAMKIATGEADATVIYPKRRNGRTKWWDIAPAHAIIEAAGGHVEGLDGRPLAYDAEDYQVPQHIMMAKKPSVPTNPGPEPCR